MKTFNFKSKLKSKIQLNEFTYEFKYTVSDDFEFKPGQFVVLLVTPPFRRSYSIVEVKNGLITLLIDVKPTGPAHDYFINSKIDDETTIMGPYGLYSLQETTLNKVFIASSTGIAPLYPMINELRNSGKTIYDDIKIDFFYGSRLIKNDIAHDYLKQFEGDNFSYYRCITQPEDNSKPYKLGRVTEVVPSMNYDYQNTEFYICGAPEMVTHMRDILKNLGADKVYFEKY